MQTQVQTKDLRKLPNHKRGYLFENVKTGEASIEPKLRQGVSKYFDLDGKKLFSRYQTIYSALFTRNLGQYYNDSVKVTIVELSEVI